VGLDPGTIYTLLSAHGLLRSIARIIHLLHHSDLNHTPATQLIAIPKMSATSAPSSARLTNDEPSLSDTFEGYDYTVSNKSLTITNEGEYNEDLPSDQESTRGCDSIGSHQTEEDHQQKESIATTIALNEAMIRQLDDFNKTQDDKYLALGASALRQYNQKLEEYTVGAKANEDRIWKKRYYEEL